MQLRARRMPPDADAAHHARSTADLRVRVQERRQGEDVAASALRTDLNTTVGGIACISDEAKLKGLTTRPPAKSHSLDVAAHEHERTLSRFVLIHTKTQSLPPRSCHPALTARGLRLVRACAACRTSRVPVCSSPNPTSSTAIPLATMRMML